MKYLKPILAAAVIVSCIINIMLLNRVSSLEQKLNNNLNQIQGAVSSATGQVNRLVDDIRKEQRWITPAEVNIGETRAGTGEAEVKLSWQIKDYQTDDKVTFFYRQSEAAGFTAIPLKSSGGGFFEVVLPFKITAQPHLDVNVSVTTTTKDNQRPLPARQIETREVKPENDTGISYYVSVDRQGSIKSSEIEYAGLEKLNYLTYGFLMAHLNINDNQYHISLNEMEQLKTRLSSASLKVFDGESLVWESPLDISKEPNGSSRKQFVLTYEPGQQTFNRLVLHLIYADGKEFAKEIFVK